jgi:signal transduction histidine kinase
LDLVVAAGVSWVAVQDPQRAAWLPLLAGPLLFAALLVRRRYPVVTMGVICLGLLLGLNITPAIVGLYTLGSRRGPARLTWVITAVTAVVWVVPQNHVWPIYWPGLLVGVGCFIVVPLLAGFWMFQRIGLLTALRDRAEQAERERGLLADQAVAAERRRIAGEMHDVVAHRVSVIAVQAGALTVISADRRTGEIAEVIRNNSTAALTELRDVLRVLRADGTEPAETTAPPPPPDLAGLRRLVDEAGAAGSVVELALPDPLPQPSALVGRAAYRVVQEALTNVGKHAPGARVRVVLTVSADEFVVEVTDTGAEADGVVLPSSGYGLVGMRERVTLAGGTARSGPAEGGGFVVRAVFPLGRNAT